MALATVSDSCRAVAGAGLGRVLPGLRTRVLDRVSVAVSTALAAATLSARRAGG